MPKLIGEATPEQLDQWKKKYGAGKRFICDGHVAYLRFPTRTEVSYANTITDGIKSNSHLLNTIWLGGSEEFKKNDRFFFWISKELPKMITEKTGEVEDF